MVDAVTVVACVQKLSDLMRTDLMADKSADEIAEIWRQYHSTRDAVAAVIPAETYEKMQQRFKEFKTVAECFLHLAF